MAFIKSHSNYVLKKKHQIVSDGTIWERDITTIGGLNQFAPGQVPIYRSGNFIISVRNDGKTSNQFTTTKWYENSTSGTVWTMENVDEMVSKFDEDNDIKIVLKQDYYDFNDFAYYGSLSELFRSSITDILTRFPGELYYSQANPNAYYTTSYVRDGEETKEEHLLGKNGNFKMVSNPFGINMHSPSKPNEGKPLKYFAEGGYKNYEFIYDDGNVSGITSWETITFASMFKSQETLDSLCGDDLFYNKYMKGKISRLIIGRTANREIRWSQTHLNANDDSIVISGYSVDCNGTVKDFNEGWEALNECFESGEIHSKYMEYYNTRFHVFKDGADMGNHLSGYPTHQEASDIIVMLNQQDINAYNAAHEAWEEGGQQGEEPKKSDYLHNYTIKEYTPHGDLSYYVLVTPCKGYQIGTVKLNNVYSIQVWLGDNNTVFYLWNGSRSFHIRPKEKFLSEFYNECDNFEKLLLNPKTNYKAIFSVMKEDDYGYYRELEEFVFPTSYGGYNIDTSTYGFNEYTDRLSSIGEYYDELFTDNLYRSMTHEAIKNFDWTFTREFYEGEDEKYIGGGEKMQKALRIFAREFDEIKSYIDNISSFNRITYDERNNLPDYFLTDAVENCGWDVKFVTPYDLTEVLLDDSRTEIRNEEYNGASQLSNSLNGTYFVRQFSQNSKKEVKPYTKENLPKELQNGYYNVCGEINGYQTIDREFISCGYNNTVYNFIEASGFTWFDGRSQEDGGQKVKYRIKSYTNERTYKYSEVNNEFLRRLRINSPHIFRHKGTLEGIEMILGMFGLKSKRWVEKNKNCKYSDALGYDYEIIEYSSFTNRIEEQWDAPHQMYRIDWLNSTKTITYDYRLQSNRNSSVNYLPYQGLLVSYRDEYESAPEPYIAIQKLNEPCEFTVSATSDENTAFRNVNKGNKPVKRRYLYPYFSNDEQFDGNPYFQSNGGWLSKTLTETNGNQFNFQFDVNDNIVTTNKVNSGFTDSGGTIVDDKPLYKETIRSIRSVDGIEDLFSIPTSELYNGSVVYVNHVKDGFAVVNNKVFKVNYEYNPNGNDDNPLMYIELFKSDGYISPSWGFYFVDDIVVYDKDKNEHTYSVTSMKDGEAIKAYIFLGEGKPFICQTSNRQTPVYAFQMLTTCEYDTNYFLLDDVNYNDSLVNDANREWSYGWRRLRKYDCEYLKINTIENYYKGNNPHNGGMVYDSGHDYFTYMNRIFKHAYDNSLFDERCFGNDSEKCLSEISCYGFNDLIDKNELIKQYEPFLVEDTKIHYFGDYKTKNENDSLINGIHIYGENKERIDGKINLYMLDNSEYSSITTSYILNSDDMIGGTLYGANETSEHIYDSIIDESTNQIVNNKRLRIKFYLRECSCWYTNDGQCQINYIDDIILNYLTQMIPTTTILDIEYVSPDECGITDYTRTIEQYECSE